MLNFVHITDHFLRTGDKTRHLSGHLTKFFYLCYTLFIKGNLVKHLGHPYPFVCSSHVTILQQDEIQGFSNTIGGWVPTYIMIYTNRELGFPKTLSETKLRMVIGTEIDQCNQNGQGKEYVLMHTPQN